MRREEKFAEKLAIIGCVEFVGILLSVEIHIPVGLHILGRARRQHTIRMALRHNEVPPETLRVPDRQLPAGVAAPIMSNNVHFRDRERVERSEEHTSELPSLMRISYAVFCLKKTKYYTINNTLKC